MTENLKAWAVTALPICVKLLGILMVIFKYSLNVITCGLITIKNIHTKQEAYKEKFRVLKHY